MYTNCPYTDKNDYRKSNPIRRCHIPHRANTRTLNKIPMYCELTLRNGRCFQYKSGYRVPVKRHHFDSVQEVSRFLHTEGRKGLYCVINFGDFWNVVECAHVTTKKEALKQAYDNLFGYAYSWVKDDTVYCDL